MIAPPEAAAGPATLRILVADDEPSIRRVYRALFQTMGGRETDPLAESRPLPHAARPIEFTLCAAGDEAWDAFRSAQAEGRPYGVVFMDVRMPPGPDGVVTAERIRALDPKAYIVMVTGFSDYGVEEIARRIAPRDRLLYLQKPFHIHEIREIALSLGERWMDDGNGGEHRVRTAEDFDTLPSGPIDADRLAVEVQTSPAVAAGHPAGAAAEIARRLTAHLGLARTTVWRFSEDRSRLVPLGRSARAAGGESDRLPADILLGADRLYGRALRNVRTLEARLYGGAAVPGLVRERHFDPGIDSVLHVPVRVRGDVAAVIWCEAAGPARVWRPDERQAACGLADCLAQVLAGGPGEAVEDRVLSLKQRYLDIFENAVDMLFVHLIDGEFISVSPGFTRITGHPVEAAVGRNVREFIAPEYHDYVVEVAANKIKGLPAPQAFEVEILCPDGRRVPVEVNSWPVYKDGRAIAVQGIARDISERRKAEELRHTLEKQLRQSQRLESIGRLAGGVAHDFNNLLTAIMGSGEMLMIGLDPEHHGRRRVEEILTAAQRAAMLTRQLLAFSRRQIMQPRTLSLNRIVTEMDALLRRVIGEDIELRTRLEPGLAAIKADPGQLEQVVVNLAVNARDAMPNGGKLTIATAFVDLESMRSDSVPSGDFAIRPGRYVRLTVEDNGVGMPLEVRGHVFEPFFSTKTQEGKGTGLGLATVYGIVKQSGGYIWFDTEVGAGTAFHILFPVAEDGAACETPAPPAPRMLEVPGGSETVLLAEDDDALRVLVSRVLRGHGYTVIEARDGQEALRLSRENQGPIDLVLTDVVMPHMGGRHLAARLVEERPGVSVVLMSGYTDQETVHQSLKETGGAFLQKPFTPTTLVKKLRRILDAKR